MSKLASSSTSLSSSARNDSSEGVMFVCTFPENFSQIGVIGFEGHLYPFCPKTLFLAWIIFYLLTVPLAQTPAQLPEAPAQLPEAPAQHLEAPAHLPEAPAHQPETPVFSAKGIQRPCPTARGSCVQHQRRSRPLPNCQRPLRSTPKVFNAPAQLPKAPAFNAKGVQCRCPTARGPYV